MGILRTTILLESVTRGESRELHDVLVDTGAEASWAPSALMEELGIQPVKRLTFRMPDGHTVTRNVGYAIIHAGGTQTVDEVVFAEEGDLVILGARAMEGLNLVIDPRRKQLVSSGPIIVAVAA